MHTAGIWRVAISADGKLMVTASEDKTIRVWSTMDGSLIRTIRVPIGSGSDGKLFAVTISPDGRTIAAAGLDAYYSANYWTTWPGHYIYMFDTVSGKLLKRLGPVSAVINDLEFSPDGTKLAAALALAGGGVRVWSAPFDKLLFFDTRFGDSAYNVAWGPDGTLAASSDDGEVRVYGPDLTFRGAFEVPSGPSPRGLAFSPDGKKLAITQVYRVGADVFSVETLKPIAKVDTSTFNNTNLLAAAWSLDSKTLYMAGGYADKEWDYPIVAWTDGQVRFIKDHDKGPEGGINDIKVLPDGGIAYVSHDPSFGIFDPQGTLRMVHRQVTADMRNKYNHRFFNSRDGSQILFGLQLGAIDPWLLDVNKLTFTPSPKRPDNFIEPITDGIDVENWENAYLPTLNKQVLTDLSGAEMARSLAVAPDRQSFVIGSDWAITRFDAHGRKMWRYYPESFVWGVSLTSDGQMVIAALGDGTIRWYRASDGVPLLSFFVKMPEHTWIAWTPQGYYAASAGGEDLIGWHFNGKSWDDPPDFFPASKLRQQFYRPDIVQLVLRIRDEKTAIEAANNIAGQKIAVEPAPDKTTPTEADDNKLGERGIRDILPGIVEFAEDSLEIDTDRPDITLHYRLRSPSGRPITRVEVLIDGRPVTPRSVAPIDETTDAKSISLSVPQRNSEVSLVAYIGEQSGVAATMPIKWTGPVVVEKKPRLFALLIGISDYDNPELKLRYAAKDAQDLADTLRKQQGVFYESVDETILLNHDATEQAIEVALTKLRKKSLPDDNVVVFMAGHGYTDASQNFYFLPTGVDLSPDMLEATAIDGDVIRKGLSRIPGKVTLFMDACHAGAGIQGNTSLVDMNGLSNGMSDGANVVMFASSTGREVSYESSEWGNGAFTKALISIFSDPTAYGSDGKLSISEIDEQLTERVEALTDNKQTPVMTKPGAVKRFFLAAL
ncbi:caspase family protein [Aestuariivirga sp.]|uniref:caspase family protein n=1 Tax=Aestuariivirga sp. TaxID=2650926 RepID=UPI0039E41A82